ncbi:Uncharacterized protein HZ326_4846 [Fusarium oxysporum f. sp. albedinis]|nr:Uncharacterized protein HZ326_4846 [Fusarium oxysporum f. sp. albedinis]
MKVVSLRDTRSTCAGKEKIQKERGSRRYGVLFLSYFLLINTAIIAVDFRLSVVRIALFPWPNDGRCRCQMRRWKSARLRMTLISRTCYARQKTSFIY